MLLTLWTTEYGVNKHVSGIGILEAHFICSKTPIREANLRSGMIIP